MTLENCKEQNDQGKTKKALASLANQQQEPDLNGTLLPPLTPAQWETVHAACIAAEREPDPAQLTAFDLESLSSSRPEGRASSEETTNA